MKKLENLYKDISHEIISEHGRSGKFLPIFWCSILKQTSFIHQLEEEMNVVLSRKTHPFILFMKKKNGKAVRVSDLYDIKGFDDEIIHEKVTNYLMGDIRMKKIGSNVIFDI